MSSESGKASGDQHNHNHTDHGGHNHSDQSAHKSTPRPSRKANTKAYHKQTSAVFRIKPLAGNRAVIAYKGVVTVDQKLGDEIVELEKPMHPDADVVGKHALPIKRVDDYDILGRIYRSNIVGSYIVLEDNYPVMYLTVEYSRTIVTGSLFQIYVSIKMGHDQKLEINQAKKYERYRNLEFAGQWNVSIECDKELKELWRPKMIDILTEDALIEFHADYATNPAKQSMLEGDVLEWIDRKVNSDIVWYESVMSGSLQFEYKSISKIRNYLIELSQDPRLYNLIKVAMECRIINRRNESNIDEEYNTFVVPEKIINMKDIRQQMIDADELILDDSE